MKEIRCTEVGYFPSCTGVARGETDDEVMQGLFQHGAEAHKWSVPAVRARLSKKYAAEMGRRARAAIREA